MNFNRRKNANYKVALLVLVKRNGKWGKVLFKIKMCIIYDHTKRSRNNSL